MADAPKASRKTAAPDPKEGWLAREIVGEFIVAPLVRGALWLVLHAALLVKRLLTP